MKTTRKEDKLNILLFGPNGLVGWELQRALAPLGTVIELDRDSGGDLTNFEALRKSIRRIQPKVIVNAAAYTAVDNAESEQDLAKLINADAVQVIAEEAKRINALLVHYSTDYVFNGSGEDAWSENDPTEPLSVYGATKYAGEQNISNVQGKYLIFRTAWVYSTRGKNFAKTILRLASEKEELKIVADQVGSPTGADLIADCTAHAIRTFFERHISSGVYHLVSRGETNWHDYARHVLKTAQKQGFNFKAKPENVKPIPTTQYNTPAKRPLNSRLSTTKFETEFGLVLPDWRNGVDRMLNEILEISKWEEKA